MTEGNQSSLGRWTIAALAGFVFLLLFARSMARELDIDEQVFIASAILVERDGLLPYEDFPYYHMPTQVYLYALLTHYSPYKLLAIRTLTTVCGTATLLLLFGAGWKLFDGRRASERWLLAGSPVLILFCCRFFTYTSGLVWNHDTSVLCCLGAFFLFARGFRLDRLREIAAAGLLLGLATGCRLTLVISFVPFLLVILFAPGPLTVRRRLAGLTLAALAALVALAPALILWARQPARFLWGHLEYQGLFAQADGIRTSFGHNLLIKLKKSVVRFSTDPGNLLLLVAFVAAVVQLVRRRACWRGTDRAPAVWLLGGLLVALLAGVMAPTPQQYQYNYVLLPFMILVVYQAQVLPEVKGDVLGRWRWAFGTAAVVLAAVSLPRWYWTVINLPFPERWFTVQEHRRGEWLRQHAPPGRLVLTTTPITPLEGGLSIYPEHAIGPFSLYVSPGQTHEERRRVGTVGIDELPAILDERPPDLIYCSPNTGYVEVFAAYADAHGYQYLEGFDPGYRVWAAPSASRFAAEKQ